MIPQCGVESGPSLLVEGRGRVLLSQVMAALCRVSFLQ